MYSLLRKFLFQLEAEHAHKFTLNTLRRAQRLGLMRFYPKPLDIPIKLMGITFPNKIGLSAGFDRNADYTQALATLGFGFIEIGTIVPQPQPGNPKPRIFRLVEDEALINRVGFASKGMAYVLQRLETFRKNDTGILGINIGKNKTTPNERAIDDYLQGFQAFWPYADYITINISSPNTAGLRDLLQEASLRPLLQALKAAQTNIANIEHKYVPIVIKLSPDLTDDNIPTLTQVLIQEKIDGVISANTTLQRPHLKSPLQKETGGLSGRPIGPSHFVLLAKLRQTLGPNFPIIASGGIVDEDSARAAFKAGANLLQIYTGLIYQGPSLIRRLARI